MNRKEFAISRDTLQTDINTLQPQQLTTTEMSSLAATHEAGHAIMAEILGYAVSRVSLIPLREGSGGYCAFACPVDMRPLDYQARICIALAGKVAETLLFGSAPAIVTDRTDRERVMSDLASLGQDDTDIAWYEAVVTEHLSRSQNRTRIAALAQRLILEQTVYPNRKEGAA